MREEQSLNFRDTSMVRGWGQLREEGVIRAWPGWSGVRAGVGGWAGLERPRCPQGLRVETGCLGRSSGALEKG